MIKIKRRLLLSITAIASALALTITPALPAAAASAPPPGVMSYQWRSSFCSFNINDDHPYRLHAQLSADVRAIPNRKKTYYQRVKLTFQHASSARAQYWQTFESKTRDGGKVTARNLPGHSVVGFRAIVGPTLAYNETFRVKAVVKLKRVVAGKVPDYTQYSYTVYSRAFTCPTASYGGA